MNPCQLGIHPATLKHMNGLATYVKQRRELLGWSQRRLTEESGIGKSHTSQIESGKISLPSAEIRRRLASALGVRHIDILIAAGEITPEELGLATQPGNPFPEEDPRYPIVELLIHNDPAFIDVIESVITFAKQRGIGTARGSGIESGRGGGSGDSRGDPTSDPQHQPGH